VSAAAFSKDRHGKSTMRLNRNVSLPIAQKKNRRLKHMSTYFALMYVFNKHAKPGTARWSLTRAADDPLVMLEMLVERDLAASNDATAGTTDNSRNPSATRPKVHPLKMISILKDNLKSEEEIFRFDLVTLNQRCVEMLRKVQAICVEQSPYDYPKNEYDGDHKLNACISHMLAGVAGVPRSQPTRFLEACLIVKDTIESDASTESKQAKALCFVQTDGGPMVIDKFETPLEDNILLSDRVDMCGFSTIIVADGSRSTML
jgi:hypothetical protein